MEDKETDLKKDEVNFDNPKKILLKAISFLAELITTGYRPEVPKAKIETSAQVDPKNRLLLIEIVLEDKHAGKLIGKKGATADAIRRIFKAVGAQYDIKTTLEVKSFTQKETQDNEGKTQQK